MDMHGYEQYKAQSVNTMTRGELLLLLYDELVKRLTRAELAIGKQDYTLFEASITRCIEILEYLDDTLDPQYPISHDLHRLYDFFTYELTRVKIGRNTRILAEVKPRLTDLRDTFRAAQKEGGV
ncbi:flagellar protein FliS [Agathobaculum sp. NSJ-28]|uniref:Flagellar protein FliS n=2 Tax=Agathobaculum TaxID=2048137 RepID=A0A923RWD6_9FIRM|nr:MULTISPECIES: flagellar export chaperone FliS [Butyricicoccaceae]MBS6882538.1 flagellar protein FliS [Clostridiaceae bacterium]SCJ36152.1 Flagellar protein fliS [uncultured Butyricicoccus sp.]MBC5725116.1 flagellar protein FliS [Agathobaculum faecis]MCU6789769.1 flagellar protein FliS [Agathobaculum ammoniilyticum]WOC74506.1 flagellar export chaperone FliS [Intestinibacillus sp. NTUH-41-i26]